MESQVRNSPQVPGIHGAFGVVLALAGRKEDGIRESLRATELDPVATAPFTGPDNVLNLAQTYIFAGEPDKAIATLEALLKMPFYLTPAWLAVDPTFDSLRQNPRFRKLVAGK